MRNPIRRVWAPTTQAIQSNFASVGNEMNHGEAQVGLVATQVVVRPVPSVPSSPVGPVSARKSGMDARPLGFILKPE